jgi:predicted small lipoprotein YifL
MSGKVLSAAVVAAVFAALPAFADLKGPAELPPAGYAGQQYVDSRGCVFLRAGYGGQVTWVPRVSRDRKQLCGYPASGSLCPRPPRPLRRRRW